MPFLVAELLKRFLSCSSSPKTLTHWGHVKPRTKQWQVRTYKNKNVLDGDCDKWWCYAVCSPKMSVLDRLKSLRRLTFPWTSTAGMMTLVLNLTSGAVSGYVLLHFTVREKIRFSNAVWQDRKWRNSVEIFDQGNNCRVLWIYKTSDTIRYTTIRYDTSSRDRSLHYWVNKVCERTGKSL